MEAEEHHLVVEIRVRKPDDDIALGPCPAPIDGQCMVLAVGCDIFRPREDEFGLLRMMTGGVNRVVETTDAAVQTELGAAAKHFHVVADVAAFQAKELSRNILYDMILVVAELDELVAVLSRQPEVLVVDGR